MRNLPDDPDWDELYFMAHEFLGLSMDEFLFDYNQSLLTYMINKKIELRTGVNPSDERGSKAPKKAEARNFFQELGF